MDATERLTVCECLLANRRWERAVMCGYWVRFAQQALGHNSKAVHHACSKHAEVTVPSLDDGEKEWGKAEGRMKKAEGEGQMPDAEAGGGAGGFRGDRRRADG